jgi:hypothetical protein
LGRAYANNAVAGKSRAFLTALSKGPWPLSTREVAY